MRHEQRKCRAGFALEQLEQRQLLAGIEGAIYNDPTGKGEVEAIFGPPDNGISGLIIFIDANNDGVLNAGELSDITDSTGHYHFDNLPLGRYVLHHSAPAGLQAAWFGGQENPSPVVNGSAAIVLQYPLGVPTVNIFDVPWVVIDGTDKADVITVAPDAGGLLVGVNGVSSVHSMAGMKGIIARGGAGSDTITFDSLLSVRGMIFGEAGNDVLTGGAAKDTISGDVGNDVILGGDGNDMLIGGRGHNHLYGGAGNDKLDDTAGDGQSVLKGEAGDDKIWGSFLVGGSTLSGGAGNDLLTPGGGRETMLGGAGDDTLGSSHPSLIFGGAGNDTIGVSDGGKVDGGPGRDVVSYMEDAHPASIKGAEEIIVRKWPPRKKCFLTSAVVEWAGKADDCHELRVLRSFRDNYMKRLPEGPRMIEDYYQHAPKVVRTIEEQRRTEVEWPRVYAMVREAVRLIEAGRNAEALELYGAEYLRLKAEYVQVAVV